MQERCYSTVTRSLPLLFTRLIKLIGRFTKTMLPVELLSIQKELLFRHVQFRQLVGLLNVRHFRPLKFG